MPPTVSIEAEAVRKCFLRKEEYLRELAVYQSALPHVPLLLDHGKALSISTSVNDANASPSKHSEQYGYYLRIQRIMGVPYLDLSSFNAAALGRALSEFHLASRRKDGTCLCHIDNQPKNILLADTGYWLIDFSDSRIGHPEEDISHLLLFWAAEFSLLLFSDKLEQFLPGYLPGIKLENQLWKDAYLASEQRFDERRSKYGKLPKPSDSQAENRQIIRNLIF
ncbi:MAG TPA: phosphotransferase [Candidatus Cloacimonadota bacterium]|nr:phosphotransferase [Candidatus Cloacimonadota bacterium]